jgi:hypothetical protein
MGVPKQRSGSSGRGGANHRSSYRGFRNSGGNVKPPSKSCLVVVLAGASAGIALVWGGVEVIL